MKELVSKIIQIVVFLGMAWARTCLAESGQGEAMDELNKKGLEILKAVNIFLGDYETKPGQSEDCREGDLVLLAVDGVFTLMLGSHPIILELGQTSPVVSEERDCKFKTTTVVEGKTIRMIREENCGKREWAKYIVLLKATEEGLSYTRQNTLGGKSKLNINCELVRVREISN
ncbi:MAG: hypothetical protein KDD35_09635 [Bdellovibrionales bacterium]|nr:hypothetical protein [Bdellovibrionales bacterium]